MSPCCASACAGSVQDSTASRMPNAMSTPPVAVSSRRRTRGGSSSPSPGRRRRAGGPSRRGIDDEIAPNSSDVGATGCRADEAGQERHEEDADLRVEQVRDDARPETGAKPARRAASDRRRVAAARSRRTARRARPGTPRRRCAATRSRSRWPAAAPPDRGGSGTHTEPDQVAGGGGHPARRPPRMMLRIIDERVRPGQQHDQRRGEREGADRDQHGPMLELRRPAVRAYPPERGVDAQVGCASARVGPG